MSPLPAIGLLVFAGVGLLLLGIGISNVTRGYVTLQSGRYYANRSPLSFWFYTLLSIAFGLLTLGIAVTGLLGR